MAEERSYHDVIVYVDGVAYRIADNYAYQLTCTKAGGWQLWHVWGGKEEQIGGEYHGGDFRIEVAGVVVCGKPPAPDALPAIPGQVGGWSGEVFCGSREDRP